MNGLVLNWSVFALTLLGALAFLSRGDRHRARQLAMLCLSAALLAAAAGCAKSVTSLGAWAILWVVFCAWVIVLVLPRSARPGGIQPRLFVGLSATILLLQAQHPMIFAAAALTQWFVLLPPRTAEAGRMKWPSLAVGVSSGGLLVAWSLVAWLRPEATTLAFGLLVAALWLRRGMWPVHGWVVGAVREFPLPTTLLYLVAQADLLAMHRFVEHWPDPAMGVWRLAASILAVQAALGAVTARGARRALAYFFLSQSALVLLAFTIEGEAAVVTVSLLWVATALAFTGFGMTVQVLEARRGKLSLDDYHGGYEQTPVLAMAFLTLGLCAVGLPGTLGFVGVESLVEGLVETSIWPAALTVIALVFNGITVLRMYLRLFGGRRTKPREDQRIRRREAIGFAGLAIVLAIFGIWPRWIIAVIDRIGGG